ncbi:hypothetical protein [Trichothermofontia sp.]
MLEVDGIQALAHAYSPQELFAALVWQRRFNQFDGPTIMTDLVNHLDLWESFLFMKPIYAPERDGLSFNGMVETLLAIANYRSMPASSMIHFIPYPADTLYILAENQDTIVAQLIDFGKKWEANCVDVWDGNNTGETETWEFRDYVSIRLRQGLWGEGFKRDRDAVIISYWWD